MPQVSSLRERRRDGRATRVAVTITGDVSPAEQVDALAVFEELSRDADDEVRCARFRIEARVKADSLSIVDGVMILEDGRDLVRCGNVAGNRETMRSWWKCRQCSQAGDPERSISRDTDPVDFHRMKIAVANHVHNAPIGEDFETGFGYEPNGTLAILCDLRDNLGGVN